MIDWILGWINLLLTDYNFIAWLGMVFSFVIINVIFFCGQLIKNTLI